MRRRIFSAPLLAIALLSSSVPVRTQVNVVLTVVDQQQVEVPGSSIWVGSTNYPTGSIASLPLGTVTFSVFPGTLSGSHTNLSRTESRAITTSTALLEFEWTTQDVLVRIVDQSSVQIPSSQFSGNFSSLIRPAGVTIALPITDENVYPAMDGPWKDGYSFNLWPGIAGGSQTGLVRTDQNIEVTASTTLLEFEWIAQNVLVRIVDQSSVEIPSSQFSGNFSSLIRPAGATIALPITDESVYAAMGGPWKDGYNFNLWPGIAGAGQTGLVRTDQHVEVTTSTTLLEFEWITQNVLVRVVDHNSVNIPNSQFSGNFSSLIRPAGATIALPITDDSVYIAMGGPWKDGYNFNLWPGIAGASQTGLLARTDRNIEVATTTTLLEFEWVVVACSLVVLDSSGDQVSGSGVALPTHFGPFSIGQTVSFPTTENAVYPTVFGAYANGYPIHVSPGDIDPASGTFSFEVLASGILEPPSFVIGGSTYSLGCESNRAPAAIAGNNVSILSSQQGVTVVAGNCTDPDGDDLTYRWLEGTTVLLGPTPAGSQGDAPLHLSAVPVFSLGTHLLTLEVSDGLLTATSTMTLTVSNAPPTVACQGAGTYQAGVDTATLSGSVADHDGGSISYAWKEGATILQSGTVIAPMGGTPVAVPGIALSTGPTGLHVGNHTFTLIVNDGVNDSSTCQLDVNVVDTQAPTLAPVSDCPILWPPNHQMVKSRFTRTPATVQEASSLSQQA